MRRAFALLIVAAVWLVPAAATADVAPTVSVTFTELGPAKDGGRKVRITWTADCGATRDFQITDASYVALMHIPKRPGARLLTESVSEVEGPGSVEGTVPAGRRVLARIVLVCERQTDRVDGDGSPVYETVRAQADSANRVVTPPRLVGWHLSRGTFCGGSPREQSRGIGASDFETLQWRVIFGRDSMLRSPSTAGILKEVRLRVSGKGVRVRKAPDSGALRKYGELQTTIYSPPRGTVKVWAEIGGVATNVLKIPVVGRPCVANPKRVYGISREQVNTFIKG